MIAETPVKTCGRCGSTFACALRADGCWCASLPHVLPPDPGGGDCLCPSCLARDIGARLAHLVETTPHEEVLRLARAQPPRPPVEWIDYTIENGDAVFTAWYLLKQGTCCGNGCRNCPYPPAQ